jgi:uncharacterized membrane protein YfcA
MVACALVVNAESLLLSIAAIVAGAVASVTGFGIGSILTPTLSLWMDGRIAVAIVSVPHLLGTALRFRMIKGKVDRRVMWRFGLASAAGGLTGALFQSRVGGSRLMLLLAVLLLFVAAMELSSLGKRMRFSGPVAWIAGVLSGLLGGLVGNQGGIRSAALLGFEMPRDVFVATATAIALFVDGARMPVYLAASGPEIWSAREPMLIAGIGVIIGTVAGARLLRDIPESAFRKVVAGVLAILGVALLMRAM